MDTHVRSRGPNFFILGAMKSGTTSLFRYLVQHPLIEPPVRKELHYYDHKCYKEWSLDDYLNQFPLRSERSISGEATAYYLRHPHAPKWLARDFPDARLIVLLRNPVDRAYSHYQQRLRKRKESRSFLDAIRSEDELVFSEWKRACEDETYQCRFIQANSYLSRGRYADQLELWFGSVVRERMSVLFSDDLQANPGAEVEKLFGFLGLPSCRTIDTSQREKVRDYEPMPAKARVWAENYFRDHNKRLEVLLDREVPWLRQNGFVPVVGRNRRPDRVEGLLESARSA